jgi:hypothetical protein
MLKTPIYRILGATDYEFKEGQISVALVPSTTNCYRGLFLVELRIVDILSLASAGTKQAIRALDLRDRVAERPVLRGFAYDLRLMTEAEKLFNEIYGRWLWSVSVVSNFRSTLNAVSRNANEHLQSVTTDLSRSLFEDPMWKGLLLDIDPGEVKKSAVDYAELGRVGARGIFETTYALLDAAVLVFYHSLLDALVMDCCRVTALHAPRDWEQDLKNTQVQLRDAKSKSYDQLFQVKLDGHLKKLERESLLTKVDRLCARCNPPSGWSPMLGYAYDEERVKCFDDQRHEIVHGKAPGKAPGKPLTLFQVSDDSLEYILGTGIYFLGLINFKYGLQFDPPAIFPQT